MKASKLIAALQAAMAKHGDLEVAAECDHVKVEGVRYEAESWMAEDCPAIELVAYPGDSEF